MGLFKSKEERRLERDMQIRRGLNQLKRQIKQLEKSETDWLKKAKRAKSLGDRTQLQVLKANLKRTTILRRVNERKILLLETMIQQKGEAESIVTFANAVSDVARAVGEAYQGVNFAEVYKNCEMSVVKAQDMQQQMDDLISSNLENLETVVSSEDVVSDDEIDKLIDLEVAHDESKEIDNEIDQGLTEIEKELGKGQKE